jgi:purine-binding chemotaxis protein CheW
METKHHDHAAPAGKYLFLEMGGDPFGIEILRIHEVDGTRHLQRVPDLPGRAVGTLATRGRQLPVVDLAPRLGVTPALDEDEQVVVVVEVDHHGERALAGLLVDRVIDVRALQDGDIEDPARDDDGLLAGWSRDGAARAALLDTDRLLEPQDLDMLLEAVAAVR